MMIGCDNYKMLLLSIIIYLKKAKRNHHRLIKLHAFDVPRRFVSAINGTRERNLLIIAKRVIVVGRKWKNLINEAKNYFKTLRLCR